MGVSSVRVRGLGVRAIGRAFAGAGAEGILDDGVDRAGAAAAFRAATEAAIDLAGGARHLARCADSAANVFVGQHVTGTDDQGGASEVMHPFDSQARQPRQKEKRQFEAIPDWSG